MIFIYLFIGCIRMKDISHAFKITLAETLTARWIQSLVDELDWLPVLTALWTREGTAIAVAFIASRIICRIRKHNNNITLLGKFSTQIHESISSNARLTRRYSVSRVLNANYLEWTEESVY
jgi:hypothetical protein